jgi:ribonuclease HII
MEVIKNNRPSFTIEKNHDGPIAGIDEAGCGAWAGPVVSSAVILPENAPQYILDLLDDSKKLSALRREKIYTLLHGIPNIFIGIGQSSVEEIDSLNIRQATLLAMTRAIESLDQEPSTIIIDGTAAPSCKYPCHTYIKGDQRSYSIAAASIIAKVTRDRLMKKISQEYPQFGWERNAGYGTKIHRDALKEHSPTLWHRKSYKPIAELLEQLS